MFRHPLALRFIYTSDFRGRFRISVTIIFTSLLNVKAKSDWLVNEPLKVIAERHFANFSQILFFSGKDWTDVNLELVEEKTTFFWRQIQKNLREDKLVSQVRQIMASNHDSTTFDRTSLARKYYWEVGRQGPYSQHSFFFVVLNNTRLEWNARNKQPSFWVHS